jgi:hypothetical protein
VTTTQAVAAAATVSGSLCLLRKCSEQLFRWRQDRKLLIQRYLYNPYLINGKKFDLRIYALVSGVDPLRVYVHEEVLYDCWLGTHHI